MKSKLLETDAQGGRTYVVVFDTGEEAVGGLKAFAGDNGIEGARVSAIGALQCGVVAWLNWETKTYEPISVDEQCEVISILGDVAKGDDGRPSLHLHGLLGLKGGRTVGGHIQELHVRPTLDVMLVEAPAHLRRTSHSELGGIALIALDTG
ncbi:PPC domain-containing DNA-binding protein [Paraburkholderia sp. BR10923]|uniref:PPC domain-containing DNA-binding protein n=1 Tax=Paraburkholderia TaxID=1822464 RepID=UPI0034CEA6DF